MIMILQIALTPVTVFAANSEDLEVIMTPSVASANIGDTFYVVIEMAPMRPGVEWADAKFDIHFDNTRLRFDGHRLLDTAPPPANMEVIVNQPLQGANTPPNMSTRRIMWTNKAGENITGSVFVVFDFTVIATAIGGVAEIRWDLTNICGATATPPAPQPFFRDPAPEDYARIAMAMSDLTVTFNANGGEWAEGVTSVTRTVAYRTPVGTLPLAPTAPAGYTFNGWWSVPERVGGTRFVAATVITEDRTVFARWNPIDGQDLEVTITPSVASANIGDTFYAAVEMATMRPDVDWANASFDIHFDNTRLQLESWSLYDAPQGVIYRVHTNVHHGGWGTPPGMRTVRIWFDHYAAQNVTGNAIIILEFIVIDDAPLGTAEIRWTPVDATAYTGDIYPARGFRNPVPADYGRVEIGGGPVVRFFDDNGVLLGEAPVVNGFIDQSRVPIPATRYGTPGNPGQVFMGWFEALVPLMHYINNPGRATAFDLNQNVTVMLDSEGVFNLYGSWLQHGDVNGDGIIGGADVLLLRQFMVNSSLNIIHQTADVNADGIIGGADVLLLRQFMVNPMLVLGRPAP